MYGDARNWDEDAYRETILKEREIETLTVFRTAWAPSSSPSPDTIVVASGDGSIASYSISSCISNLSGGFSIPEAEPDGLIRGHDGPAYDVKFYGSGEDAILLSCGDDGRIRGWQWKNFLRLDSSEGNDMKPVFDLVTPQHKGPWGALSPIPENNAVAVDTQGGCVFSAAGDSCAYCWDVVCICLSFQETCKIKIVFKGHLDYLHCIVARNSTNQIITGSEDGTARIWDCKSGKCIQLIEPEKDKQLKGSLYVGCIALDASETWLACSNGCKLSVWNLPASESVSNAAAGASIQDLIFDHNQILAVGAEPVLSRFDIHGAVLSEIPCAPQSAFSVSMHTSGMTAVGGYGGLVDVISQCGSHYCTFRCKCL